MGQVKLKIKKGDLVEVICGNDKGSKGRVLEVVVKEQRVIVEGVRIVKKHTKPNAKHTQGGIIPQEAPIHISNVMLIDPTTSKPTKIGRKLDEQNKLVRYAKKSMEVIK